MNDSLFVCDIERISDLTRDGKNLINRKPAGYFLCEGVSFDQLQHKRTTTSRLLDSIDRTDVWMVQRSEDSRFPFESCELIGMFGEFARENFDRDIASQPRIASAIHFTHPAF